MTRLKQLWLLTALGSVAILAGGYFLLVSPKASEAAQAREDAETQLMANARVSNEIKMLKAQAKDLPKKQAELAQFSAKVPNNPALPQLIRSLTDAAENAGVEVTTLSPAEPALVVEAAPAAAGADGTAAAASTGGMGALAQIPITLQVSGSYSALTQFFSEIESLPRAFLVSGVAVAPGKEAGKPGDTATASDKLTASLNGRLFMTTNPQAAPVAETKS